VLCPVSEHLVLALTDSAIWTYWEDVPGRTRAPYLDLCLETIRFNSGGMEVRVMSRDDVQGWLPELDSATWYKLPAPNYRSDYVRSRVLDRYGGIWIDVDTIAVAPLTGLLAEIDHSGIVCWGTELGRCFTNLCAASPRAPFVEAWARRQDEALGRSDDWAHLQYSELAQNVTWDLARELPWKAVPMSRVAPIPWYEWRRFLSRFDSPSRIQAGEPIAIVLWNAVMGPALAGATSSELMKSRSLLGRLFRIGMGISRWEEEEDVFTKLQALSDLRFSLNGQRVELNLRRVIRKARRRIRR